MVRPPLLDVEETLTRVEKDIKKLRETPLIAESEGDISAESLVYAITTRISFCLLGLNRSQQSLPDAEIDDLQKRAVVQRLVGSSQEKLQE